MTELYISVRNMQDSFINQNKASITITRTTRTAADDGGYTSETSTVKSQDVRIYAKSTRVLTNDDGGYHAQRLTKMIAKYNADILSESATNLDTFTYGSKQYKVKDVKDIYTGGQIVFKECYIEELT
jgi:hypothetical protein